MELNDPEVRPKSRPELLIISEGVEQVQGDADLTQSFRALVSRYTDGYLTSHFSNTDFVHLLNGQSFEDIHHLVSQKAALVRQMRRDARLLFSVYHFNGLFDRRLESVNLLSESPYNYIEAARQDFPVSTDITTHFANFLDLFPSAEELHQIGAPVIASSILLDHYPPGMHRMI